MLLIKFIQKLEIIKKISSSDISKEKIQWQENFVQVILISTWLLVVIRDISPYTNYQIIVRESKSLQIIIELASVPINNSVDFPKCIFSETRFLACTHSCVFILGPESQLMKKRPDLQFSYVICIN